MLRLGHIEAQNGTEKGHAHSPILVPLFNPTQHSCSLQTLVDFWHDGLVVDFWHDGLGVCRAIEQVGGAILLSVSRFLPETGIKNQQQIDFNTTVRFPCYTNVEGDIHFFSYDICALVFHIGATPITGHYRAALRCHNKWMVYEDGQLPDSMQSLTPAIQQNVVLFWLIPTSNDTDRTSMAIRSTDPAVHPDEPVPLAMGEDTSAASAN